MGLWLFLVVAPREITDISRIQNSVAGEVHVNRARRCFRNEIRCSRTAECPSRGVLRLRFRMQIGRFREPGLGPLAGVSTPSVPCSAARQAVHWLLGVNRRKMHRLGKSCGSRNYLLCGCRADPSPQRWDGTTARYRGRSGSQGTGTGTSHALNTSTRGHHHHAGPCRRGVVLPRLAFLRFAFLPSFLSL